MHTPCASASSFKFLGLNAQPVDAMVNFTILAGGYSSFIATYLFNSDANTLTLLGQNPSGQNPSWIALHPTNQSIL